MGFTLEAADLPYTSALEYATKKFQENGKDLNKLLPNFEKNYRIAQQKLSMGQTKLRKDMPVIRQADMHELQRILVGGGIKTHQSEHRGNKAIHFSMQWIEVGKLIPIQKQVYFDKVIDAQATETRRQTMNFLQNVIFIVSSDNRIIDGHHRWLSAILINPAIKIKALVVDLPIIELLPLTLAFSDMRKNVRNA